MKKLIGVALVLLAVGFVFTAYQDKITAGFDHFLLAETENNSSQAALGVS